MKIRTLFCAGLLGVVLAGSILAQSAPLITMDKVMTGDDLRTTGVASLTPVQRAALDQWLSAYTMQVLQYAQGSARTVGPAPGPYAGTGARHWIQSKADNGGIIVLEDGSMWEINSLDRVDTSLWLPITDITVVRATSPIGDYKYTLINTEDAEKALAKYLGKQ